MLEQRQISLTQGTGRTGVSLSAFYVGKGLVVVIYNENAHIGAVAVGEYDHEEKRASSSVITRRGHRDDAVAKEAAQSISRHTREPVCVIAGIHIDSITDEEINQVLANADGLLAQLTGQI
ncbi:hypothetical protein ACFLV1_01535 [Chloroflexota bacterium]